MFKYCGVLKEMTCTFSFYISSLTCSFTHPHVIPNLCDLYFFCETTKCWRVTLFHAITMNGTGKVQEGSCQQYLIQELIVLDLFSKYVDAVHKTGSFSLVSDSVSAVKEIKTPILLSITHLHVIPHTHKTSVYLRNTMEPKRCLSLHWKFIPTASKGVYVNKSLDVNESLN